MSALQRSEPRDRDTEYHDGNEPAVCAGQWCCGCAEHPIGKPWGWNHEAWQAHYEAGCQLRQHDRAD